MLYPPEDRSDLPSEVHLAELIREQVLSRTRDEVPHAVEVVVGEVERREDGLVEVERPGLGRDPVAEGHPGREREGGWCARSAPRRARSSSATSAPRVFLDLQVRVREHWRRDDALLDRIGIE